MKINKYPKVMEVSIYKDFRDSLKRVVFMYKNGMYLAWAGAATLEEADSEVEVTPWLYAREITPEPDMEMSMINAQDIVASWPGSKSHLLNEAFIIGAKKIVRLTREDLDELYAERDGIESRISEKERALEFYNKKIKEWEAKYGA